MKKFVLSFRQFINALRVIKNLETMQSDLYKLMIKSSENSRDINIISKDLIDINNESEKLEVRIEELESLSNSNYRKLEDLEYEMSDKVDRSDFESYLEDNDVVTRYDVMDIVRDESCYVSEDEIGDYTLNEEEIRDLIHEEMQEFSPESVETANNLSDEEYQNIVRDVIREIVQRLEM